MSWFNTSQLSSFAKQALSQAQKSIDRVLDIKEDETAWADSMITPFQEGTNSLKGSWENSNWGGNLEETQKQVVLTPTAITKPVRRTVVDESENFFGAFLSSPEVNLGTVSSVVSKPPAKSQRPKEEVKPTSPKPIPKVRQENCQDDEKTLQQTSPTQTPGKVDLSREDLILVKPEDSSEEKCDSKETNQDPSGTSESLKADLEPKAEEDTNSVAPKETKDNTIDLKDQKLEDRQSNTPSPPVSNFSSGTSTTSDIEVLDHESVISESSVSSRQEVGDSKGNLNLMQNSFQLLSPSVEYGRLDEFQKLTESCSSSDAFERIDSFSVQSLDSRSISEINSDDELSGRGCTLVAIAVGSSTLSLDVTDSTECKTDEEVNETLLMHSSDDIEMEESGRSATPVNTEQPDLLVTTLQTPEVEEAKQEMSAEMQDDSSRPKVDYSLEDMQKVIKQRIELVRVKEESSSIYVLKDEFTHRIAEAEKRAQLACKERDTAKKEVKAMKEELATRLNSSETAEIMREKDEQIKGLMEEGEKLSKQQLHNSNIIKKLRSKEKEHEHTITKQTKNIRELEDDLQHLKQTLDGKEELEKQHRENIRKLNGVVERQEKDVGRLQADLEEVQEKNRSLQAALDSSYKELAELHRANATKASEAQEVALSCEIKAKEEICMALEKAKEESQKQQEALAMQVADLRIALQRAEQQAARKEDYLRQEIAELQQILSQQAACRTLHRDRYKTSYPVIKICSYIEAESQTWLASAVEKERASTEELLSIKMQISAMESQNSLLRQEKSRFQAQLEVEKSRLSKMEDEHSRNQVELENIKMEYTKVVEDARKEKNLLTSQLEMEKMRVEQEKKKVLLAQEAVKEKERKSYGLPSSEPGTSTPTLSRSSSVSGADLTGLQTSLLAQDESHDHLYGSMTMSISGTNLYDAVRMGAGSSVIENLQSQLKLREGEITQLQLEIGNLEKTRSILAEEVVRLNNLNDELEEKVKDIPKLRAQMKDLDQRYNTILQMYGEKAEEAEELRLDLEDVKIMYKTQIDELLQQRNN
uniref:TATA element modulatory factor 1 TATA binding domain-containing protein n=1 Tax=Pyxicephalus adspersus TaxID=30357 RepID=A0AAV3A5I7_PYXAD|nr:TPA: hypothetical protein GDO54_016838 [Pyxicephalus adspersus]